MAFVLGTMQNAPAAQIPKKVLHYFSMVDQTYSNAETYEAVVNLSIELALGERESKSTLSTRLTWKKPNMILAHNASGTSGTVMVSNGKKYVKYVPNVNEYIISPPPANLQDSEPMQSGVLGQLGGLTNITISDKPSDNLKENLVKASLKSESETIRGIACAHIQLVKNLRNKEVVIDLFVEKNTGRITRMIFDNKALLPPGDNQGKHMFTLVEEHDNVKINSALPPDVFEFSAPRGAIKVDNFSFQKKIKKLP